MDEKAPSSNGCIIGIDFGTTYSGCCYCYLDPASTEESLRIQTAELETVKKMIWLKKKQVFIIPDRQEKKGEKTPTVAIYDENMKLLRWGNAALEYARGGLQDNEILLQKFKLNLPTMFSQRGGRQIFKNKEQSIIAQSLIATIDYFKILFSHAHHQIQGTAVIDDINYSKDNIRFVITVPAVWNDTQRSIMRDIAYQAGLITQFDDEKKLQIINESLASTLYCEYNLREKAAYQSEETKGKFDLQEGDIYITCDAGGGTVDIAAFVVTKSIENKTGFSRCQISADSGDKCGSTYIDLAMEKLLMEVLYHPEIDSFTKEEEAEAYKSVVKLTEQFSEKGGGSKFNFGEKQRCNVEDDDEYDNDYGYQSSSDDSETGVNEAEEEEAGVIFDVTSCTPVILWRQKGQCMIHVDSIGIKRLHIPYNTVAVKVFDDVIDKTIQLLDMQIKKIRSKDKIKALFLVGGLGNSPYLNQKIRQHFVESEYNCGAIINDEQGDMATMRGAVHYGIESAFGAPESNIAPVTSTEVQPYLLPDKYDALICYDIGYDTTQTTFTSLTKEASLRSGLQSRNMGQDSNMNDANTAELEGKTISLAAVSHMRFDQVLSFARADLKTLMVQHLKIVHQGVCAYLKRTQQFTDQEKYRFCITLENSYDFFSDNDEMRDVAIQAGLIPGDKGDQSRVLVLRREDAAALHIENRYFASPKDLQSDLKKRSISGSTFLQIHVNSDNYHLSLYEASKITGNGIDQHVRNVRCTRRTTFEFNYLHNVAMALRQHLNDIGDCFACDNGIHAKDLLEVDDYALRKYFASGADMDDKEFTINSLWKIKTSDQQRCCQIIMSGFNFLQNILGPVMNNLASNIASNAVQAGIVDFQLDRVFLVGKLLQLPNHIYEYIESKFIQRLSACMNLGTDLIVGSDESDQAVVKGALLYGLIPSVFTERIARRTYMVSFKAFKTSLTEETMERMKSIKDQDERYDTEAKHVIAGDEAVNIYYQPARNPSSKISVLPEDPWTLITRGDKITLNKEASGIQKRFFAEEDAVVYATIYIGETAQTGSNIHSTSHLQKIHQFEVYLKRQIHEDQDDFGISSDKRLHFNICAIPLKNEFKFEATLDVKVGKKIPEFRYRDEFFVSHLHSSKEPKGLIRYS